MMKGFDFLEFVRYGKGRIFMTVFAVIVTTLFVDLLGLKYWQFAIFFVPINFVTNYFVYKYIFRKN